MKLIGFEIKKLLGVRFLRVALVVLLSICFVLSFYSARNSQKGAALHRDLDAFYQYYFAHQTEMDEYYKELIQAIQDPMQGQGSAQNAQKYAPDGFTDLQMFTSLYSSIEQAQAYSAQVDGIVTSANHNLTEFRAMGIGDESYNYRLQESIVRTYSALKNTVRIGIEPSCGWSVYFSYDTQNVLLFGFLLLLSVSVASCDRMTDMLPMIHCTKRGKKGVAIAKMVTVFFSSSVLTLLFSCISFTAIGMGCGYSSAANAIQSVEGFTLCPYALTVGQYAFISLVMRIFVFALFGALTLLLAVWIQNRALSFSLGVGLLGCQYVLSCISYVNSDTPLKNLNLITIAKSFPLFTRLRACNLFGVVCPYVPMAFAFCIVLTTIALVWFYVAFVYQHGVGRPYKGAVKLPALHAAWICKSRIPRFRPTHLYFTELYKMLVASGLIFVLLLSFAGKVVLSRYQYHNPQTVSDSVFYDYMTELQGQLTEQKLAVMQEEREQIDSTLAAAGDMQQKFIDGQISAAAYAQYLREYANAQSQSEHFSLVESKRDRLIELSKSGTEGWLLYDTGWAVLLGEQSDLLLLLTVAWFACQAFSAEYGSKGASDGFVTILRSTPKGRRKTFFAKMLAVITVAVCVSAAFSITDIVTVLSQYALPSHDAPVVSLAGFESISPMVSIGGFFALLLLARCTICCLLALCVSAASSLLKRSLYALVMGVTAIALVELLLAICGIYAYFFAIAPVLLLSLILVSSSCRNFDK